MTPSELKELKENSILMFKMRGGTKQNEIPEKEDIKFAFATVVATKNINKANIIKSNVA